MVQKFLSVVDGGQRTKYKSGALRERPRGKGRFDLIPGYPLLRLAVHYENGALKYADRNWEKGLPLSSFIQSLFSHIVKYIGGSREEDHMAAIAWNAFGYMHTEEMIRLGKLPKELADFPVVGPWSPTPVNDTTRTHGGVTQSRTVRGSDRPRSARNAERAGKAGPRKVSREHRGRKRGHAA